VRITVSNSTRSSPDHFDTDKKAQRRGGGMAAKEQQVSKAVEMEVKAGTEEARRVLNAAVEGSIDILEQESDDSLKNTRCTSGKTTKLWPHHVVAYMYAIS
jgi:hypothetical protein